MNFDKQLWNTEVSNTVLDLQQKEVDKLTSKQKDEIKKLRKSVAAVLKPKHNDYFLLKWLVARKFDVAAAETMLRAHLKFRQEYKVDTIQNDYVPLEVVTKYVTVGVPGDDRDGNPVFVLPLGNLDIAGLMVCTDAAEVINLFIYYAEYSEIIGRKNSEKYGKAIRPLTAILDFENFKLRDYINKLVFDFITQTIIILEKDYPDLLKKCFIINAPKIFSVFWAMIKPFLSEATRNKIVIYGKDNWKGPLLETIHPDQLPEHWGGNMIDPIDGNPRCTSIIVPGGKIPESYYKIINGKLVINKDLKLITVPRGGKQTVEVEIEKANSTLSWTFQTEDHDIGFGVVYKDNPKLEIQQCPIERIQCKLCPQTGCITCNEIGTYSLVFDNSYSWYRSKKIYYEVHVLNPEKLED